MLKITDLCHSFGDNTVFKALSLEFPDTGAFVIMGDSGCGKTTLLNMIAGIIKPSAGEILHSKKELKVSYMFQETRLLPWMSAAENVNLVLGGKKRTLAKANELLSLVGLGTDADKYPSELSGGMNRRVSFARALAYQGDVLLLDEPFNGLDEDNARKMIGIIKVYSKDHLVIAVTHTREYAEAISDNIIYFNAASI